MKELMLELLTYEPFGEFLSEEETYICKILSEKKHYLPPSMIHDLFSGFCYYVEQGDFKDIVWLQRWKSTYCQNQNYTNSTKNNRIYYPLLFKKICFYIIVRGKFTDKDFMGQIGLRVSLIRKWGISTRFRRYAEAKTYSAIRSYRRGVKKEYIVSIVKKLYYEAGLQVYQKRPKKRGDSENQEGQESRLMILKNLPVFVDVFAGTASVAASMVTDGCPPPVVNDYDPVMVCFTWASSCCQRELCRKIANFHKLMMKQAIDPKTSSYNSDDYEDHYYNNDKFIYKLPSIYTRPKDWDDPAIQRALKFIYEYSDEDIKKGQKLALEHQEFIIRTRSGYNDVERFLNSCNRNNLRQINFNTLPKYVTCPQEKAVIADILGYAFAQFFYYSFAPSGTSSGGVYFSATNVTVDSYLKYLRSLNVDLNVVEKEDNPAAKAQALMKLPLKASSLTLESTESSSSHESTGSFSRHLKGAKFYCKPFQDILKPSSDKIYYLDSPYFLTVGYDVGFSNANHKDMLDLLRKAEFKWIFSMQYNPSSEDGSSGDAERKEQPRIKNYGDYYRGFYTPLQLDEEQGVYILAEIPTKDVKELYIILFDFEKAKKKWENVKETEEMLVVNFNCLPAIPLHDTAVVFPFDKFLQCADAGMDYKDIVQRAIAWRKENIEKNYARKVPV